MIEKRIIEQVIQEQKAELESFAEEYFCSRKEESQVDTESGRAQVVIGVRRSGKSVLCYNVLHKLGKSFAYINFDDDRLETITATELNDVLEVLYKEYGDFSYLFIDEIQNVEGWHLFVNRLLRQKMHIIITGSNAKLLSGELATHLTGRTNRTELYPLSFAEYCDCKNIDTKSVTTKSEAFRRSAYDEYLKQGGFPELLTEKNKVKYISALVEDILNKDLVKRFNIKNIRPFIQLANHLMNIAPTIIVEKELATQFGISHVTVGNYIEYIKQAYLLVGQQCYSPKSKLRVRNEKVYPIDVALMDGRVDALSGENLGCRLETQVFLELLRRNRPINRSIFYFRQRRGIEADFVVCQNNQVQEIYQVSYDISNTKTLNREIRGLLAASSATNCHNLYLITDYKRETIETNDETIHVIPAYEWLLNN